MSSTVLIFAVAILIWSVVGGVPLTQELIENNQSSILIDINNPNPESASILQQHNVNLTELQHQRALRANKSRSIHQAPSSSNSNYPSVLLDPTATATEPNSSNPAHETHRQHILDTIKNKVASVIMFNGSTTDTSAHQITRPVHDIAAYSMCPSLNPIIDVFRANNNSFNLYFDPPAIADRNLMYLSSATLRLFKVDRNGGGASGASAAGNSNESPENANNNDECGWNSAHSEELIRVTVSAYVKKNRKYKKKTYSSIMIQKAYSGWIELNVRLMIGQWERKNLGLAVDVHDQDENQLRASQFFHLYNCEASASAFPFTHLLSTQTDPCNKAVPRYPRIDYQFRYCDRSRLKAALYNRRCQNSNGGGGAGMDKSKPHHRHHHHSQRHPDASQESHNHNSFHRTHYRHQHLVYEHTRAPVAIDSVAVQRNAGGEGQQQRRRPGTSAEEEVVEFVTA